jgi:hypothetical protein
VSEASYFEQRTREARRLTYIKTLRGIADDIEVHGFFNGRIPRAWRPKLWTSVPVGEGEGPDGSCCVEFNPTVWALKRRSYETWEEVADRLAAHVRGDIPGGTSSLIGWNDFHDGPYVMAKLRQWADEAEQADD